jgi:hypothetical protein
MNTPIPEDEVTKQAIFDLFQTAYMKVSWDDDGDVRVHSESGPRVCIIVDEERKHLRFLCFYRFDSEATEFQKLQFVNTLNDTMLMLRFALDGDSMLIDYYISFEEGVLPYQVVSAARRMSKIAVSAIAEHDVENIVL